MLMRLKVNWFAIEKNLLFIRYIYIYIYIFGMSLDKQEQLLLQKVIRLFFNMMKKRIISYRINNVTGNVFILRCTCLEQ